MKAKVSVVVPINNTEEQLPRCIDSLLNQRMREIEIILVDDGSTDCCGKICDAYASKEERIKIFHTHYQGVAAARNLGMQKASCDYIMFVDSDDWISADCCGEVYRCAVEYKADIVMFATERIKRYSFLGKAFERHRYFRGHTEGGVKTREEAIDLLFHEVGNGPCNKLYRKKLFQGISFPEGRLYEDIGTIYKVVWKAESVYYLKKVFYYYCYRFGSITTINSAKARKDWIEMSSQQIQDLFEWGYSPEKLELHCLNVGMAYCIMFGLEEKQIYSGFVKTVQQCNEIPRGFTRKRKVLFVLLKYCPPIFNLVCNLWGKRWKIVE